MKDLSYNEIKLSPDDEVDVNDDFNMKCIKYNIASFFLMDYNQFKKYLEESNQVFFSQKVGNCFTCSQEGYLKVIKT